MNTQQAATISIHIEAFTWSKDSHQLFNYQTKNHLKKKIQLTKGHFSVFRNEQNSEIKIQSSDFKNQHKFQDNWSLLATVFTKQQNGQIAYYFSNKHSRDPQDKSQYNDAEKTLSNRNLKYNPQIVVSSLLNIDKTKKGHLLAIGEKIRFGRVQYTIVQMSINGKKQISKSNHFSFSPNNRRFEHISTDIEVAAVCCMCMEPEKDPENFLTYPIKNKGNKYIHLNCLRQWMLSKIKKQVVNGVTQYIFGKLKCQISCEQLPKLIVKDGIQYSLIDFDRPQGNYLILQWQDNDNTNVVIIDGSASGGIIIGRDHSCDMVIKEISVSRKHAKISFQDGRFVVYDNWSKFGTLVKLTQDCQIKENISFQVGRTILVFKNQTGGE